ncbi:VQ motif-containing protein [Carex littledalei]|uniref:VQ motif-containing protein n=1 Tax=Carex littledalei TaxID=544730 RepID=A0A833R4X0_9POAL|nr:VQ motif-containing protein [Carex littledalei]
MPSSSCSKNGLQGRRPHQIKISSDSMINKKKPPVVVHLRTPRVIHAKPHEFMSIVQNLTGKSASSPVVKSNPLEIGLSSFLGLDGVNLLGN